MARKTKVGKQADRFLKFYKRSAVIDNQILLEVPAKTVNRYIDAMGIESARIYVVPSDEEATYTETGKDIHFLNEDSEGYLQVLATSKYILSTRLLPDFFVRKEEQIYVNLWMDKSLSTVEDRMRDHFHILYSEQHNLLQATHVVFSDAVIRDAIVEAYNLRTLFTGKILTLQASSEPDVQDFSANRKKTYTVLFPGPIRETEVFDTLIHISNEKDMIFAIGTESLCPFTGVSLFDQYVGSFPYLFVPDEYNHTVFEKGKDLNDISKRLAFGNLNIYSHYEVDYYHGNAGETYHFHDSIPCAEVLAKAEDGCMYIQFSPDSNIRKVLLVRREKIYWSRELTKEEVDGNYVEEDFAAVLRGSCFEDKKQYTLAVEQKGPDDETQFFYLHPSAVDEKKVQYCFSPHVFVKKQSVNIPDKDMALLSGVSHKEKALCFTVVPAEEAGDHTIAAQIVNYYYQNQNIQIKCKILGPNVSIKNVIFLNRNPVDCGQYPMEYATTIKGDTQTVWACLNINALHLDTCEESEWEVKILTDVQGIDNAVTLRLENSLLVKFRNTWKLNSPSIYYKTKNSSIFFPRKTRRGRRLIYTCTTQSKWQFLRHKWWGTIRNIIRKVIYTTYHALYKRVAVDDKIAIFISFHGRGYSDNPKAIYEAMRKDPRFQDFRFIWFIKNHKKKDIQIEGAEVKEYYSIPYFYYMSKAKYWIVNCKLPRYLRKKKEQIYLQTWHGTPLKRLAHDIEAPEGTTFYRSGMSFDNMVNTYDVDVARYDYMISPNRFCTEIFPSAFQIDPYRLIETGYPRNDFITNATPRDVEEIKNRYQIPLDKKVILYAPTWRDDSYVAKGYTFELEADFQKWRDILGPEYVVIFKPHYLIINHYENDESLKGFLYSVPAEAEINELYVISDMLITDYSSVFFDYAVLNRPIYFYMYDLDAYKDELRGFYLDIYTELPGKIYEDENAMLEDIHQQVYDYSILEKFNERFNHAQTGDCAEKVLDIVFGSYSRLSDCIK